MKNFDTNQTMKTTSLFQPWLKFFAVLLLCINSTLSFGQIAAWDFTGETALATSTAEIYDANMDASNLLTRGAGAAASAGGNSFRTVGFQNNGISVANTDYFEATFSAATGYTLSLSTLDARFAGTTTYAASPGVSSQFAYSLDGTTFTLIGSPAVTIGSPATMTQIDLSGISALQNVDASTTVTLRYYASGQTPTGGWGFNSPSSGTNGFAIGGTLTAAGGGPPTKLVITNISPSSPTAGSGFDVTVQAQDAGNVPQNVTSNTDATLTLNTGTGILSGTLVNTIANGTSSIVISGVNYNVAETGVVLTASATSGMSLTAGNSAAFDVLAAADHLAFSGFPASGTSGINISSFSVQALRPDLTVDNTYTGTVTLTKVSGAGNLAGTVSTSCVAGIATFNAVQFDAGGTYVLEANSGSLTLATSSSISITGSATLTEDILPQFAINGTTSGNRLQYVCRLTLSDLAANTTYRYFTGASTNASLGLSTAAGNFYVINNTAGADGYIVGQSSSKSFAGTLMGGDEFTTGSRYGEFTTDGSGAYSGWFGMVPTGNAVFNDGSLVYFYVQLNDGAGGTVMAQSIRTASTIEMIATATTARAARGLSNGTAEDMVFLYDNTAGTGRPLYGTWIESDGITPTYTTWYNVDVDGVTGSWGAYLPTTLANGVQRIESRNVQTATINVCPGTSATGVWSGAGNTVNPTSGTSPIVFSVADASFANLTWYADVDGDGYGDASSSLVGCALAGYVLDNTDCNDANAAINPGATESCNGIDDDCDGLTDESGGTVQNITANTFHCTIQAAVNAATAGDVIEAGTGTYNERVVIDKSLTLQGVSEAGTILDGTGLVGNGKGITINNGITNVTIKKLTVQDYAGSNGNSDAGIYGIGGNNNLTVQNVSILNNVGGSGFYANGPVNTVLIDSVTSTGHTVGARGIVIWNGLKENITIMDCHVYGNNCCGIELQDGTASGVTMTNNNVHDNGDNGIGIVGMQGPGENVVSGNTLLNNGRFGMEIKNPNGTGLATGAGRVVIENNNVSRTLPIVDVRDIVGIAVFRRGVLPGNVDVPYGAVVQNNIISGYVQTSTSDGFGIVAEGTNHTVSGNNVSGCDVGIQRQSGHLPYPGDGNQNNLADTYFGRGNSPVTCGVTVSGNTLSNTIDTRDVPATAGSGLVTNLNTSTSYCTIQAAVNAATAGDVIEAGTGTYNERVVIDRSLTLQGVSEAGTILDGTGLVGNGKGITINNGITNVTIKKLTVQDYAGSNGNSDAGIYGIGGNNNLTVQNVSLLNNVGGSGFYANGPVNTVLIDSVTSTGHTVGARGIVIWNGLKENITIMDCHVYGNNCCGIELQDGTASGVTMTNNNVHDNGDNGIGLVGLQGPGENLVSGNTLLNNGRFGMEIKNPNGSGATTGAGRVVIENNNVSRTLPIVDARDIVGIAVFRRGVLPGNVDVPNGAVVQNNIISGYVQTSTSDGFGIVAEGTNHTVSGNNVSGCDVGIQRQSGHLPYPGDGDQSNLADTYFGRGNSPVTCGVNVTGNTLSNTIDTRDVGIGASAVTNSTTLEEFCSIQDAINDAQTLNGHTIIVSAGTYAENIIVNKSLTILGPNAAVDACSGPRVAEAIIVPSVSSIDLGEIIHVAASNVTISGFTIDGDNTSITSGFTSTNGADIDAAEGVTVYETGVNNLTVSNNIIQNLSYFGVTLYDYPAGVPSSGHSIANNKIQNLGTYDATSNVDYWGGGVLLYNNQYAAITNNCMTNVRLGVQTGNFYQANPGAASSQVMSGNTIEARRTGVFHNLHYSAASAFTFSGNTITALANANETRWDGIALSSLSVPSVSTNNTINGNGIVYTNLTKGYEVWNVKTPLTASSITGGSVSGVDIGVFANNYDGYSSDAPDGAHATISGVTITPNATGVGVRIYDNALATSHGAVRLDVSGCTISGGLEGIKFEETLAGTVGGTINNNNIGATAVGVNVTSMVTSASNVFSLTNNTINITTQVAGPNPTTGVLLRKVTGTTAAAISGNNITGPFIGYLAYNLNTTPASDIDGGTITGVLQGVSFLNVDPLTFTAFAPSNTTVKNVSMNGFSGNYPALPNNNFHAGVYSFTTGSDLAATLNVTLRDLTIDGTGKTSPASGAIVPADFSTGAGVRQTIVVDSCTLTNNLNRAISVRGKNAIVDVNNSTLSNNGGDPFGAGGNDGFGIIAREGSIVTVDNNFITNPSSNVGFTVTALATDLGTSPTVSLTATNNSINNNGNASGYLARNLGGTLTATCNWWGTGNLTTIASLMSGAVTYQPMLIGGADNDAVMDGFQPAANCEMVLAVSVTGTAIDETCANLDNGSIDITAANGIAPYTYLWSNASTSEDQTGLDAGTYTVTVTDAYGNSATNSFVVNPGATPTTWYADVDGDTYGDAGSSVLACIQPVGYVTDNTDCNDNNAAVNPTATEICNGIDDDCDGLTDESGGAVHNVTANTFHCTIQGAINAATAGDVINVPAGTYPENVIVNKSVTLNGPNAAIDACSGTRVAEAIIVPSVSSIDLGEIIHVAASNVTISGFTIDGDNTSITSGFTSTNGADIDAAEGVTVYETGVNNLTVSNNIIQNLSYFGVTLYDYPAGVPSSGHSIANNKIQNLGTYDATSNVDYWGGGVLLYNNQYAAITNNCMTNVRLGVQTGNFYQANPGAASSQVMSGNTIEARRTGVFHNLHYSAASAFTFSGNTITALANANETRWDGIALSSLSVPSVSTNNTINGNGIVYTNLTKGYEVWNVKTPLTASSITGGSVSGVDIGVFANNYDGYSSDAPDGAHATISGVTITPNATGVGVRIYDNALATSHGAVRLDVSGCTISGGLEGIKFEETLAGTVGGTINNNNIGATAVGVNVTSMVTSASNVFSLTNNTINITTQVAGPNPTTGVLLRKVTGTTAAAISGNNITGPFIGYLAYNLNTTPASDIDGGTITGVLQGVSFLNVDPLTFTAFAPSNTTVKNVSMNGFSGNYPALPNNNFHAGVYSFTTGSDLAATLNVTLRDLTIDGTGKTSPASGAIVPADFSTGAGVRQTIVVDSCTLTNNLNRAISVRGKNAIVDVNNSTLSNNGGDPFGAGGNDGFGIIAREGSIVTVDNNFITNPSSNVGFTVTALATDLGTSPTVSLTATNNSINNNGNASGYLARNLGGTLTATCNWWGTGNLTTIASLMSGAVTYQPMLIGGADNDAVMDGFQPAANCEMVLAVSVTGTAIDETCANLDNGSIDITAANGIAPYTYLWSNASTTEDQTGLDAGTYTVTVTDALGNSATNSFVVNPGATPLTWYADADGDGYGDLATGVLTCNQPLNYILDNSDCNDAVAAINPGATEVCNGIDDDCDGDTDDDDQNVVGQATWYADADGDTFGDAGVSTTSCNQPIGYVSNNTDCDDADNSINPGATEACNGVDDDCNGLVDDNLTFITYYNDFDGDGYGAGAGVSLCSNPGAGYAILNGDCNDAVAAINPAAQEICDGGIDNDCDGLSDDADPSVMGQITWYADADGDGYGDLATGILTCNQPLNYILDNSDCNDAVAAINPGATEVCNGIDDDCDGDTDDDDQNVVGQATWYADADGDTYGDAGVSTTSCNQPIGYVSNNTDCDDADIAINPGATEACNGVDDDCNGLVDDNLTFITYYVDFDGDGYGVGAGVSLCSNPGAGYSLVDGDCNDAVAAINPGATEVCNNIDDDCNGLTDDGLIFLTYYVDGDGDGYGAGAGTSSCVAIPGSVLVAGDCNDADAAINPGAQEICDGGIDNDCDGLADDADPSVIGQGTYYADVDGDGYGAGAAILACIQPVNTSLNNLDCNDADAAINPAAQEICDGGIDNDCDGLADDADPSVIGQGTYYADVDGDGYGAGAAILACIQPVNTSLNNLDCNDADAAINPAAQEICDGGIDNDCDGLADDADPSVIGQGTYYADVDGDGYGAGAAILACIQPVNTSTNNTDCNDAVAAINPAAQEICDGGIDNDCDGLADDADPSVIGQGTYYTDADGDGYGAGAAILACIQPVNTSTNNTDCNDAVAAINPGAQEICDGGIDNDCDGLADDADPSVIGQGTYYSDVDGDGYGAGAAILACIQPVNTSINNLDCNDADAAINPAAQEICDGGIDNDCDGLADDADPSVIGQGTYYADVDGDGYGAGAAILACIQPVNTSLNNLDCNDNDILIHPAAQEICDGGIDNDCDGLADDADPSIVGQGIYFADNDGDGYGAGAAILACIQPVNTSTNNTDCNDANATIYPGATEVCNGVDDDCDGIVDNTMVPSLGTINGPLQQCLPISSGSASFSVVAVPGVLTYTWTVPAGFTIVSGQGTTTLNVSWTAAASHFGIVGPITVTPNDACFSGTPSTAVVDINYTAPVRPPSISGAAKVCPGDVVVYSIANVARASSYLWTVPAGVNITSGQGTNIITATITGAFGGGVIEVVGVNVCGASPSRTKTMNFNIPGVPSPIAGITTGLCSVTGNVFSTAGTPAATSYVWSTPPGVTITSGQGTNTITVDINGSFTSGSVFVSGVNGCGTGSSRSVTITGNPGIAGLISGPTTVCPGATGIVYQVATVGGANNYTWTVPNSATITSGQGTKIITVDFNLISANNQTVSVRTDNACGQSPLRSLSGISINNIYCGPRLAGENSSITQVNVFPNPATDLVTIQFNAADESNYRLRLTDMLGREIFVKEGTTSEGKNTMQLGLETLNGGVYFVEIQSGEGSQSIRLMVE